MKKPYHIVTRAARESAAVIEQFSQANGQNLLPIVKLIQKSGSGFRYSLISEASARIFRSFGENNTSADAF